MDYPLNTDVFGYLMGDGFVMVGNGPAAVCKEIGSNRVETSGAEAAAADNENQPREVWTGIEDDVRELERLLR